MGKSDVKIKVVLVGLGSIADIACNMAAVSESKDEALKIAKALAYLVRDKPDAIEAIIKCVIKEAELDAKEAASLKNALRVTELNRKPPPLQIVVSPD